MQLKYSNGDLYIGDYKVDMRHRKGIFSNGNIYMKHGKGILTYAEGDKYEGDFKLLPLISHNKLLFVCDCMLPAPSIKHIKKNENCFINKLGFYFNKKGWQLPTFVACDPAPPARNNTVYLSTASVAKYRLIIRLWATRSS